MAKRPGDPFAFQLATLSSSGALADADSLPTAAAVRNGADDGTVTVTVTRVSTGLYSASGTLPVGYAAGDDFQVRVNATVGGTAGAGHYGYGVLDSKRVGDLHDSAYAGGAVASVTDPSSIAAAVRDVSNASPAAGSLGKDARDAAAADQAFAGLEFPGTVVSSTPQTVTVLFGSVLPLTGLPSRTLTFLLPSAAAPPYPTVAAAAYGVDSFHVVFTLPSVLTTAPAPGDAVAVG